ncbi:MAG: response regulator [Cytophagaceae bacterium]
MKKINILIADDHPIFLKGLREVLEMNPEFAVVAAVTNGLEAVASVNQFLPDVIVLDVDMPKMNGLEAAEELQKAHPEIPVILLTMHKEKAPFLKALDIGVLGYVLKENAVTDIMHAIQAVVDGHPYISPEMSAFLLKKNSKSKPEGELKDLELLTPTETKVLHMVARYKTSKEIADELFISEKTVFNHRMNIAKKLNITGKNGLLKFAIENLSTEVL